MRPAQASAACERLFVGFVGLEASEADQENASVVKEARQWGCRRPKEQHMRRSMRFIHTGADTQLGIGLLALVALLAFAAGPARAATAPSPYPSMAPIGQYLSSSQAAEIALARSAAPKSVSDGASVMVLGKTGYEAVVKGTNGFVCLIQRSWAQDFDSPEFWNPHARTPECWNSAAVSSYLPEYLKRTQWVLAGVSKDEMLART